MKLTFLRRVPDTLFVACSGGADSVALLHACMKHRRTVSIAFYDHGTEFSSTEYAFVKKIAQNWNLPIIVDRCTQPITGSKEKFWRDCRYQFFQSLPHPVAVGTQLNDAAEWYLMTCLRGEGHFIEYRNQNVIRPLLTTSRQEIDLYCTSHQLEVLDDPSNADVTFTQRNKVRAELLPLALEVNPGLMSVVKKRIEAKTFG